MSGQQNVNKVSGNVKTQGGDYSNAIVTMECYRCGGKHISLMNAGLKKRNVIIVVRETISQRNAEQNGETITPTKYAKTNEHKPITQMASGRVQR